MLGLKIKDQPAKEILCLFAGQHFLPLVRKREICMLFFCKPKPPDLTRRLFFVAVQEKWANVKSSAGTLTETRAARVWREPSGFPPQQDRSSFFLSAPPPVLLNPLIETPNVEQIQGAKLHKMCRFHGQNPPFSNTVTCGAILETLCVGANEGSDLWIRTRWQSVSLPPSDRAAVL